MIERARKIAQSLIRVKKLSPPINIMELVQEYASIEIDYDVPFEYDGFCFFDEDKPKILINGKISSSRQKFTVAHELGHILIPGHRNITACNVENTETVNSEYDAEKLHWEYIGKEREANTFASELLMPSSWIKEIVMSSQSYEESVKKINELTDLSIQAITIKVIEFMEPGNIIFIDYQNKGKPIIHVSGASNLSKYKIRSDELDTSIGRSKLEKVAKSVDRFNFNNYYVEVYDIYDDINIEQDIYVPNIKSTDILMEHLENEYEKEEATKLFRKINGIVSNINSRQRINTMTKNEYYNLIKNKFRNRDGDIRDIAETIPFQQYIAKRYDELS